MQMLFMPDIRVTPMQMLDAKNVNVMVLEKVRHTGFCQFVAVNEDFALVDGWDELKAWRSLGFTHVHGAVLANRSIQSDSYVRLGKPDFTGFHREQAGRINDAFNEGVRHGIKLQETKEHAQIAARFKDAGEPGFINGTLKVDVNTGKTLSDEQLAEKLGKSVEYVREIIQITFNKDAKALNMKLGDIGLTAVEALNFANQRFHSRQADQLIENLMGHLNALLISARNVGRDDAKRELVERLKGVVD